MSLDHHDGDATPAEPVVARFDGMPSPCLRAPMQRVVRHLHAFVLDRS
ncbi:hypothetical protein JAO10_27380 [Burkholderia contaminans]|uniref:Intradiol ring-cleavage dioxygenase n=1 Tax=Burkholderia contaminans TaxID=488447 RepID=A0AAP4R411_9BURK|nr:MULTISPECIES: hypothetical protein [Burkholderia]MBD1410967.1 hypothetical protein [Burkholderia contaminans]MBH9667334.1 hypothetical protein [Burkholderia contaminans]MBH9673118.1 hypothetical protein [Burkholderia contaminans]MBH9703161.1 hypothetical protein [Burkholderia contaminans]MBH9724062.1 hypothetical protein [Burkholderia contaminans]